MLLTQLHDEPLIYVFQLLHGRDICKLEYTCKHLRHISYAYDHVVWRNKCKVLWERKVMEMLRMSEEFMLSVSFNFRDKIEMESLFEQIHVPLHEKVYAFKEVYNMKDSNKLIDKIKKIRKKRKLDAGVSDEDRLKLEPSWKALYSLDYLTEKFHGKYRKKKGPKLYLSPLILYSPFTVPKSALPMPKARIPTFQSNRFWGVGNADEIYYVIKQRPEPKPRSRTNSLTGSGENAIKSFFTGRNRSNSVSGETHKTNPSDSNPPHSKLSSSTNSLPPHPSRTPTKSQQKSNAASSHPLAAFITKTITTLSSTSTSTSTSISSSVPSSSSSSSASSSVPSSSLPPSSTSATITNTLTTNTTTTTTSTSTTVLAGDDVIISNANNKMDIDGNSDGERKNAYAHPILLPLGHLYFEHRPNGSIDTVGGIWSVIQTRKGRMLVQWRKWRLTCYAEPLTPTKLAYEWLPDTAQVQPTSYLDLNYEVHGPWHGGKVVAEKLWKMRPWYDTIPE